jgi:uncharacterized membrane protein YsdA (DUF1294 family)/cold shock CspA family protein
VPTQDSVERQQGVLAEWNDDRGFGFITPAAGGPRVFAHISAFPRGRRPTTGCEVTYDEVRDQRNRPRATQVRYRSGMAARGGPDRGIPLAALVAAVFLGVVTCLVVVDEVSVVLLLLYVVLSAVTFLVYGADKSAAVEGRWRTSEATLHALDLAGGWPGGLVARRVFRHKTTKQPFRTVFWVTAAANCAALAWFVAAAPLPLP